MTSKLNLQPASLTASIILAHHHQQRSDDVHPGPVSDRSTLGKSEGEGGKAIFPSPRDPDLRPLHSQKLPQKGTERWGGATRRQRARGFLLLGGYSLSTFGEEFVRALHKKADKDRDAARRHAEKSEHPLCPTKQAFAFETVNPVTNSHTF